MANWKHTLDLKDLWDKYDDVDNTDIPEDVARANGKEVARRLRGLKLPVGLRGEAEGIATDFEVVSDIGDFNEAMNELWDFADDALIWVKTLF